MSVDRLSGAPVAEPADSATATRAADRARLAKMAAEFESLLLANVLKDMRSAGRWSEEDSGDMLGAGAFGQTFDTELARTLSQSGGFGLSSFLMKAFDRYAPAAGAAALPTMTQPVTLAAQPIATGQGVSAGQPVVAAGGVAPASPDAVVSPEAEPAVGSLPSQGLIRPTATLTSAYGWRRDPLTGATSFHRGVDLKAAEGDPVGASGAGRVVFSGQNGGYGTTVVVEHANGLRTRYAHLSAALVAEGDQVSEGQTIGRAGHTGRATGPHVHYEVLAGGRAVDPLR